MWEAGYAGARAGHWRLPPIAGGSNDLSPAAGLALQPVAKDA